MMTFENWRKDRANPVPRIMGRMAKKIQSGTFAEYCYKNGTVQELIVLLVMQDANPDDVVKWGITPQTWRESIAQALFWKFQALQDKVREGE